MDNNQVAETTKKWVNDIVIDLNLCPFANHVISKNQARFVVTNVTTEEALLQALHDELKRLDNEPAIETTLLVHPQVLSSFEDYNQFLEHVDLLITVGEWEGVYQVASFHPDYQFNDTKPADVENYTNRSPYPMLHLLREKSLEEAIEQYPDVDQVPERNIALLKKLGTSHMQALWQACFNNTPENGSSH